MIADSEEKVCQASIQDDIRLSPPEETRVRKFIFSDSHSNYIYQYEVTSDPALLHQYAILSKNMFINRIAGLDAGDKPAGFSLLAFQGKQCVGGVQAVTAFPRIPAALPCEREGFSLQRAFPELDLYNVPYGEISGLLAISGHQEDVLMELFRRCVDEAIRQGAQYLFMVSTPLQIKRYRDMARLLDLSCTLRDDVFLGDYPELAGGRAFLTVLDLTMLEPGAARSLHS